jgi:crotonobetainyl-CoA:carnitine CoA-transferase CaiB-like acyl-CoA transferase
MRKTFKQKTLDEWDAVLGDLDICWGRIQSTREVLEDPLFLEREAVVEIEGQDGKKSKTLGVAVKLSETPGSVRTPPVDFGESTAKILKEFGYSQKEIKDFENNDVI